MCVGCVVACAAARGSDAVRTRRVQPAEMTVVDPELRTLRNLNTQEDYLAALSAGRIDSSS